ncbi:MAG: hypothetical protein FWF35_00950 [Elusimicrobia bacterium]|nr:hypothetical protein [Elusimicrobiota bacterium]
MRIEIKKISIVSLLTSAFAPAVFIIMLISSLSMIFTPSDSPFFNVLMQAVFIAIVKTLIIMICAVIGAFVYNFLCAVGMKGLKLDLEDVK